MIMRNFAVLGIGLLLTSACSTPAPQQTAAPPVAAEPAAPTLATPLVSINEVMVAVVDHAAHNLWDVEQPGKAPKSDADWGVIHEHAVQLAAAGPEISVGGTGPS